MWDVVVAVESVKRIHRCPMDIASHGGRISALLHRRLDLAIQVLEEQFAGTTIADLLAESGPITPLCDGTEVPVKQRDCEPNKQPKPHHRR